MKIHYKPSISDQLRAIKLKADVANKVIDYVALTEGEARALYQDTNSFLLIGSYDWAEFRMKLMSRSINVFGITLGLAGL